MDKLNEYTGRNLPAGALEVLLVKARYFRSLSVQGPFGRKPFETETVGR